MADDSQAAIVPKEAHENAYGNDERAIKTAEWAKKEVQEINDALNRREQNTTVFNGVPYSKAYEYNQKKGINYAPPRGKDDREISLGLPHEKIVSFVAIFLKYVFRLHAKCYSNDGKFIPRLGDVYELGIEFSRKLEQFAKKIAVIYWEVYSQGDAFVLEDWEVKTIVNKVALKDGQPLAPEEMDFTYEFLEGLTYRDGDKVQTRRAVSRLMDGRMVILDNPELDDANGGLQAQRAITLEEVLDRDVAEQIYGTLAMWKKVPTTKEQINTVCPEATTLFDVARLKDPAKQVIVHRRYNKVKNRFNIFVNGVAMLPMDTPLTLFYPRGNYPITQISAERMSGSAYSRSVPAKTKFNSDYADWVLKMLAQAFEQDVDPALLVKGKYMLTKDLFKAGKRTHGISKGDFDLALPDGKGVQQAHFSFLDVLKEIMQTQTVNATTSGEISANATATEIATVDQNQQDKLGMLLDGLVNGFLDMAYRRAETIESKYTIKQRETVVDGKKVAVYQNFTVNVSGVENFVAFDDSLNSDTYDTDGARDNLFKKAFDEKKAGRPSEFWLVNPDALRKGEYVLIFEIRPERIKDSALQLVQMKDEFDWLLSTFPNVNREEMQKEYLEITGRTDDMFLPPELAQLKAEQEATQGGGQGTNMGTFGKPTIKGALREKALGYVR